MIVISPVEHDQTVIAEEYKGLLFASIVPMAANNVNPGIQPGSPRQLHGREAG